MSVAPVINWLPYQKAWIGDASRFKIGMMSRRAGKTFGMAGELVDDCIQAEISGIPTKWTILSRSEKTALEAMTDAVKPITRAFWEAYNTLQQGAEPVYGEDVFRVPQEKGPDAVYRTFDVTYPGGSRITALSASPDAARGFGGNLVLDEFAFHYDSRGIWGSAFPVVLRGNKLRIITTPNGRSNKFYELWSEEADDTGKVIWSKHRTDIYEAVAQGLDVDIEMARRALMDEDAWAQEFELQFLDAASAWLTFDLIASCEDVAAGDPGGYQGGQVYVGVDIAIRNDLFVIWVLERVGNRLVTRDVIARQRITFAEQDALLDDVFDRFRVVRCAMDQTGMGEKPVEDAIRRYGASRVEGVILSGPRKLDLATHMKQDFEDRTLAIPAGDPVLRADLHAVRSIAGPTGARRLMAGGDTDGHADRFWALALASGAATSVHQPFAYQAVHAADASEDRDIRTTAGFGLKKGLW